MTDVALQQCLARIEEQLGWGASSEWTSNDFEELSVQMQDKTGQVISATTLKRIWGRVSYKSKPSTHSLNTLASFLGYGSWRVFVTSLHEQGFLLAREASVKDADAGTDEHQIAPEGGADFIDSPSSAPTQSVMLYPLVAIIAIGAALFFWDRSSETPEALQYDPDEIVFTSRSVAQGVPNTVVFNYDVGSVAADSFFIQQSQNFQQLEPISPALTEATSIYYYPGYFRAWLIADGVMLKEHTIHVTTDGWKALIESGPVPVYLPEEAMTQNGRLAVVPGWREANGLVEDEHRVVGYYNVRDYGDVSADAFSVSLDVKNEAKIGQFPCKGGEVYVGGERGMMGFAFAIPGCTGNLHLTASDVYLRGNVNDLSALSANVQDWQTVQMQAADNELTIQIGGNEPFTVSYNQDTGRVVGLLVRFEGAGSVDNVVLKNGDRRVVFEDYF